MYWNTIIQLLLICKIKVILLGIFWWVSICCDLQSLNLGRTTNYTFPLIAAQDFLIALDQYSGRKHTDNFSLISPNIIFKLCCFFENISYIQVLERTKDNGKTTDCFGNIFYNPYKKLEGNFYMSHIGAFINTPCILVEETIILSYIFPLFICLYM